MYKRQLKREIGDNHDIVLLDAPPGTSCPVVETIAGTDYLILVTEPTPFGMYDLTLMVEMVRELNIPFGVIINKAGIGNRDVYGYLQKERIELLGEVAFSKAYASEYANGNLFSEVPPEIQEAYCGICRKILRKTGMS